MGTLNPAFSTHLTDQTNPHGVTAAQTGAIPQTDKGIANGVPSLNASQQVQERLAYEGVASGVPVLDANLKLTNRLSYEGIAGGVALLDASSELPNNLTGAATEVAAGRTKAIKTADGVWTVPGSASFAPATDANNEVVQLPAGAALEATTKPNSVLHADGTWGFPRAGVTEMSASSPTAVTSGVWTQAPLDTSSIDTDGAANVTGNNITTPASLNGLYAKIEAHIRWPTSNAASLRSRVLKNGTTLALSYFGKPTTGVNQSITQDVICPVQSLVTGDIFTLEVYHNLGSNLTPVTLQMRLIILGA